MSDLKDLSADYKSSAELLRRRLKELRAMLRSTDDPEERWHINQRIKVLTPMLTHTNDIAKITENYYEKGGVFDVRYGFNTTRRCGIAENTENEEADKGIEYHHSKRAYADAADCFHRILDKRKNNLAAGRRAGGLQVYDQQDTQASGKPGDADYAVLLNDSVMERFFGGRGRK